MAITCPWCGTNYLEFVSNCKNCGGPQPLPAESAPGPIGEIPLPPPAPRQISDSYAWRMMFTDPLTVVGFVFVVVGVSFDMSGFALVFGVVTFLLGLVFLILGFAFWILGAYLLYRRFKYAMKLVETLRTGEPARGEITDVRVNYNVRVNGRRPFIISYRFKLDGRELEGKVSTFNSPGPELAPGRAACILYLPAEPQYNAIYPHP